MDYFRLNEGEGLRVRRLNEIALNLQNNNLVSLSGLTLTGNAGLVVKVNPSATGFILAADATGGSGAYTVTPRSATYTETATSGELFIKASGTFTINLPTAVANTAKITVKLVSAGTVTIDPSGAQTIDGGATATVSTINEALTLVSDGSNWLVV